MAFEDYQRAQAVKKGMHHWLPQLQAMERKKKLTAGVLLAGIGGVGAYKGYQAVKAIRREKKNPKRLFSRTRKAYHRSQGRQAADFERQFHAEAKKHPRGQGVSGKKAFGGTSTNPTWTALAGEFTRKRKIHERRIKELDR